MGVNISLEVKGKRRDITPGWRSQMASWLQDISGGHDALLFTEHHVTALKSVCKKQRRGEAEPPFDHCDEWTKCFNEILREIKRSGRAIVYLEY
jgi:hypothetical protein